MLAAGMLMLLGCGGGSSNGSSLTKTEFTKKVNQMCKQEKKERAQAEEAKKREVGVGAGDLPTPAQQAKIVKVAIPYYEQITGQIQELTPSDQAEEIETLVQERENVAEIVKSGGPSQPALAAIFKANKSAIAYGLNECSI